MKWVKRRDSGSRVNRFVIAALIVISAPALVWAQRSYYTPFGARTYALGTTGTADDSDAASVAYNPAVLAPFHGVVAGGLRGSYTFPSSEIKLTAKSALLAGGYHFEVGDDIWLGAGAAVTYVEFNFECIRECVRPR